MGYSARYHAFSIIAIFTALAIGIVIGAGFGQDLVSDASEDLEQSLSSDLDEQTARADELAAELEREEAFGIRLYPPLVDSRLEGETIGVIALGDLSESLARNIEETIEPTGGELTKVAVIREPPDIEALGDALGPQFENLPQGASEERLGRLLGAELVEGGRVPARGRDLLFDRFSGQQGPVDNVILAKSPPEDATEEEQAAVEGFEEAIIEGIRGTEVPSVYVETSTSESSSVPFFDALSISTVDSLDLTSGKISAVFALLGADGNYGIKETADRPLPDLVFPAPGQGRPPDGQGHRRELAAAEIELDLDCAFGAGGPRRRAGGVQGADRRGDDPPQLPRAGARLPARRRDRGLGARRAGTPGAARRARRRAAARARARSRWITYVVGIAFLGLFDDVLGRGAATDTARGWRGHARAVVSGQLSTGAIKALGAVALASFVLARRGEEGAQYVADIALLLLATNLLNLFDTGPGRAEKVFGLIAAGLCIGAWTVAPLELLGPLVAPVVVGAAYTLRERAMLGDTGSNVLGALAGIWILTSLDETGRIVALVVIALVTAYGEFRSLGSLIERVPPLRYLDSLGR